MLKKTTYRLAREEGKWFIYEDYHTEMLHLRKGSADWADDHITYSQFSEIKQFNAYTLVPTEEGHELNPFAHFSDHDWVQEDVFYDDTRVRRFILPKVRPGVITVLRYTRKIKDAHLWGGFFFSAALPVEQAEVKVEFPSEIDIIPTTFNLDKIDVSAAQSSRSFSWKAYRIPAQPYGETHAAPLRATEPHLLFRIASYRDSTGKTVRFLKDYKDLYRWYYPFVEPIDSRNDWRVGELVEEITAGGSAPRQRARLIFRWVQEHIRYLAFEEGWSGFIPEVPDQVLQKGYGDCKSMSSLLVAMLRTTGVPAYFAWVGSRELPYTYDDLPTPIADNHMMVMAVVEKDTLWLDATSPYRAFGEAASFVQDKEALVALGPDSCLIRRIGIRPAAENTIRDSCTFELQENTLRGKGVIRFSGFAKTIIAEIIQQHLPADLDKIMPRLLQYEHPTLRILSTDLNHLDGSDQPLEIHYRVALEGYHHRFRNEIYINPHPAPIWKEKSLTDSRVQPWINDYAFEQERHYTFRIPEGFRVGYLLLDDSLQLPDFGYRFSYRFVENNQIRTRQHFYNRKLEIPKSGFPQWNRLVARITRTYQENIHLIR